MEDKFSKIGLFYSVFLYVKSMQASLKNSNFQKATNTNASQTAIPFSEFKKTANTMSRAQWKIDTSKEQGKLAPKETHWNLAGTEETVQMTRTRGGGAGRPDLNHCSNTMDHSSNGEGSSCDESYEEDYSTSNGDDTILDNTSDMKPSPTRIFIDGQNSKIPDGKR